ncbi:MULTISPECIES: fibronectin type III domain-containing protein [Aquimarina]|uniref:fibronectin type III domain-containing protein n=1 Tax=Aquimarina TaxID=290174 RepID=UPI000B19D20F|nr:MULTISPECIES: fibronectin type III domain-containing protein [Aquimarina]
MSNEFGYLLIFLVVSWNAVSQQKPVQVTSQLIPPYSLRLSEYETNTTEKLIVNLYLTDINTFNRQVRLKLYIENNAGLSIQSSDVVIGAPSIFLDGGISLRLSNLDLRPYFSLQNLRGVTPQQYNTPLPEGLYRFCFEVYDIKSGQQLSRKSCVAAYLLLNDPPFLNLPKRDEQVVIRDPQNIIFQWTPRHLNATNVEYEFTLSELWDNGMNPQAAFLASRPIYQTTTYATTLLYGPGETMLLPDKKYGWRVRAIVSDGITKSAVFKNDGYSEIFHFTYAGDCVDPQFIMAKGVSPVQEKITWQGVQHKQYIVEYRKKDVENAVWFGSERPILEEATTIYKLTPGTTYEFRVGGQCQENGPYTYSQIYEFTTQIEDGESTYNCGITPEIKIENQNLLPELVSGDTFTAGDFPVLVHEVSGRNGNFTGMGWIKIPYLNDISVGVVFKGIAINTDYELIKGMVETTYDVTWSNVDDIGDEIEMIKEITSVLSDKLNALIDKIKDGKLTGKDLDALVDKLKDDLPNDKIKEVTDKIKEIKDLEEDLANATTEKEKEKIKEQIKELNEDLAEILDETQKEVEDLIVNAIGKYYNQNKSQEEGLVAAYNVIFPQEITAVDTETASLDFEFEFEGEIVIDQIADEKKKEFGVQEKYHLYFLSKVLSENKDLLLSFVNKIKDKINLLNLLKQYQDNGDSDVDIVDKLAVEAKNALQTVIDEEKYKYLN